MSIRRRTLRSMVAGIIGSSVYWLPDLISQASANSFGLQWGDLLQNAGFAALVFYLIAFRIPQIEDKHIKELERLEQRHEAEREKSADRHRAEREEFYQTLRDLKNSK